MVGKEKYDANAQIDPVFLFMGRNYLTFRVTDVLLNNPNVFKTDYNVINDTTVNKIGVLN